MMILGGKNTTKCKLASLAHAGSHNSKKWSWKAHHCPLALSVLSLPHHHEQQKLSFSKEQAGDHCQPALLRVQ